MRFCTGIEESALELLGLLGIPCAPLHVAIRFNGHCEAVYPPFEKPALSTVARRIGDQGAVCVGYGVDCIEDTVSVRFLVRAA